MSEARTNWERGESSTVRETPKAQTNWDRARSQAEPGETGENIAIHAVAGAWKDVATLAKRCSEATQVERDLAQVFERRAVLARRLSDAVQRRDQQLAAAAASDWIKSELRLSKLFEQYRSFLEERQTFVAALPPGVQISE